MNLYRIGIILVLLGITIVFISSILFTLSLAVSPKESTGGNKSNAAVAGCIIIFFIPICFGVGSPDILHTVMIMTLLLIIIVFVLLFLLPWLYVTKFKKPS